MNPKIPAGEPGTVTDQVLAKLSDLSYNAEELVGICEAVRVLSEMLPARISLRQALALLFVAQANSQGRNITMSEVREYFESAPGEANVGQSMAKSFQVFYGPENEYNDGLGLVMQRPDVDDRRQKFLVLTLDGHHAANDIARATKTAREKYRAEKEARSKD